MSYCIRNNNGFKLTASFKCVPVNYCYRFSLNSIRDNDFLSTFIPEDASGLQIYVETYNTTTDFSIDEAIGAPAGAFSGDSAETAGDVNNDGKFDVADVVLMQRYLLNDPDAKLANWKSGDLSKDNLLDASDLSLMKQMLIKK